METLSGNTPQKRKQPSSSSVSDTCTSPTPSKDKHRQDKKKLRHDSTDSTCERRESIDSTDIQDMLADIQKQLANVATKDDINKITARLDYRMEQLESLVFDLRNETDILSAEVKTLREENRELRDKVSQCMKEQTNTKRDINDQEQHGRQFNVRVYGIPEVRGGGETVDDCVKQCANIFAQKIGVAVTKDDIEIAHRTGKPGGSRPRPIIARFYSRRVRSLVLADRRKLKQTGVSVGEDLTQLNYKLLRRASQHSAVLAAWSSNGKILTKLKNGKTLKLDIQMDIDREITRAMT